VKDARGRSYLVDAEFAVLEGRPEIRSLHVRIDADDDVEPITGRDLRIPIAGFFAEAVARVLHEVTPARGGGVRIVPAKDVKPSDVRMTRSRARLDDEFLRDHVARVYREAFDNGDPNPTQAVADQVRREGAAIPSRSTAGRWVGLARKRGFLSKTTPRRPGA
jgi:hypothetical protein